MKKILFISILLTGILIGYLFNASPEVNGQIQLYDCTITADKIIRDNPKIDMTEYNTEAVEFILPDIDNLKIKINTTTFQYDSDKAEMIEVVNGFE